MQPDEEASFIEQADLKNAFLKICVLGEIGG